MLEGIKKIWKPDVYQGNGNKKNYFEGWYFKLADKDSKNLYAIIPGISFEPNNEHAFIQVLNGKTAESWYLSFKPEHFSFSKKEFSLSIGDNHFTGTGIRLNINQDSLKLSGEIRFGKLHPWPVKYLSPGVMGWYAFVPFMECYHGVLSFYHDLSGNLVVNGNELNFDGGNGYIEKDWGTSFPGYYIWIQSNHFEKQNVSLMASVANIPWLGSSFDGFIIGLSINEKLFRFTTYTGAKIKKLRFDNNKVEIHAADKNYRLEIDSSSTKKYRSFKST